MIYSIPDPSNPIKQGDIFRSLPRVLYNPAKLLVIADDKEADAIVDWNDLPNDKPHDVVVSIQPCFGIVVTQDCDTTRDPYIAFFEIDQFFRVSKWNDIAKKSPQEQEKWWGEKFATQYRAKGQKFFYLPGDVRIGFNDRMAADYQTMFSVSSDFLNSNLAKLRVGRLNQEADEHFREHVSHYFRRYPYDEWYPFTKGEAQVYQRGIGEEIELRDYQK